MSPNPAVSVVIPTHDGRRFHYLVDTIESLRHQTLTPDEIVVVVDHNEELFQRAGRELAGVTVLRNAHPTNGVSGNRNTGAFHARGELIAFLDDDVVARPHWLERLVAPFSDDRVVGSGGAIEPIWTREPTWVPNEFLWAFGASYTGMPTETTVVRNVWSASMVVRRDAFEAVGGFRTGFGKVGDRSRPEDTELCIRMAAAAQNGMWVYVPCAVSSHHVPEHHHELGYFLSRCYNEGRGKVAMARLGRTDARRGHTAPEGLGSERRYLVRTLPAAVWRGLADTFSLRDVAGAGRAGAVLAGVAAAAIGGAAEMITRT